MTPEDLALALEPVLSALENQPAPAEVDLTPVIEALQYQAQVQYGVLVGLGLVVGVVLIHYLLDHF